MCCHLGGNRCSCIAQPVVSSRFKVKSQPLCHLGKCPTTWSLPGEVGRCWDLVFIHLSLIQQISAWCQFRVENSGHRDYNHESAAYVPPLMNLYLDWNKIPPPYLSLEALQDLFQPTSHSSSHATFFLPPALLLFLRHTTLIPALYLLFCLFICFDLFISPKVKSPGILCLTYFT